MAFRRTLSTRATIIAQRYHPSFSYVLQHGDDRKQQHSVNEAPPSQTRSYGTIFNKFGIINRDNKTYYHQLSFLPSAGAAFCRHMSTTGADGSFDNELIPDVSEIFTDTAIQAASAQAPVVNEVAVAAAESALPVAALQYVIDNVHTFTGLNCHLQLRVADYWGRLMVELHCCDNSPDSYSYTSINNQPTQLMRPHLEAIKEEMQDKGMDPMAVAEGQKRMKSLFKEYGVSPLTPLKGLFIQAPIFISFFLAISNMAEKVPSFKTGGAFWFLDLTTPDTTWVFPILTAASFLLVVEANMQEGMEGNPIAGPMKNFSRVLAFATVPLTHSFPKAIFCYWITTNLFSLVYGLVLKAPGVKDFLRIPEIPKSPPTAAPQNPFDIFSSAKKVTAISETSETSSPDPEPVEEAKPVDRRISSSSVLSQRVRALEKQVKGRKKTKN
ncbi:hypothetical protein ACFE04_006196 [Oxalis oulophora]